VVKDFKQIHGIDYDETFSLVAMLKSVQILLKIDAYFDYEIWQMDAKTTFFNGNLIEDVYMTQLRVLSILNMLRRYVNFKDPFMD
jgi:hypothetical protein